MTKKISLTINGSRFDIDVEIEFAKFLEKEIEKDLNQEGNNSFKALLQAYVRKNYELYEQQEAIVELLSLLNDHELQG